MISLNLNFGAKSTRYEEFEFSRQSYEFLKIFCAKNQDYVKFEFYLKYL